MRSLRFAIHSVYVCLSSLWISNGTTTGMERAQPAPDAICHNKEFARKESA